MSSDDKIDGLLDKFMRITLEEALVQSLDEYRRFLSNEDIVRIIFLREKNLVLRVSKETKAEMLKDGYRLGRYQRSWGDWWKLTIALLKSL